MYRTPWKLANQAAKKVPYINKLGKAAEVSVTLAILGGAAYGAYRIYDWVKTGTIKLKGD